MVETMTDFFMMVVTLTSVFLCGVLLGDKFGGW